MLLGPSSQGPWGTELVPQAGGCPAGTGKLGGVPEWEPQGLAGDCTYPQAAPHRQSQHFKTIPSSLELSWLVLRSPGHCTEKGVRAPGQHAPARLPACVLPSPPSHIGCLPQVKKPHLRLYKRENSWFKLFPVDSQTRLSRNNPEHSHVYSTHPWRAPYHVPGAGGKRDQEWLLSS